MSTPAAIGNLGSPYQTLQNLAQKGEFVESILDYTIALDTLEQEIRTAKKTGELESQLPLIKIVFASTQAKIKAFIQGIPQKANLVTQTQFLEGKTERLNQRLTKITAQSLPSSQPETTTLNHRTTHVQSNACRNLKLESERNLIDQKIQKTLKKWADLDSNFDPKSTIKKDLKLASIHELVEQICPILGLQFAPNLYVPRPNESNPFGQLLREYLSQYPILKDHLQGLCNHASEPSQNTLSKQPLVSPFAQQTQDSEIQQTITRTIQIVLEEWKKLDANHSLFSNEKQKAKLESIHVVMQEICQHMGLTFQRNSYFPAATETNPLGKLVTAYIAQYPIFQPHLQGLSAFVPVSPLSSYLTPTTRSPLVPVMSAANPPKTVETNLLVDQLVDNWALIDQNPLSDQDKLKAKLNAFQQFIPDLCDSLKIRHALYIEPAEETALSLDKGNQVLIQLAANYIAQTPILKPYLDRVILHLPKPVTPLKDQTLTTQSSTLQTATPARHTPRQQAQAFQIVTNMLSQVLHSPISLQSPALYPTQCQAIDKAVESVCSLFGLTFTQARPQTDSLEAILQNYIQRYPALKPYLEPARLNLALAPQPVALASRRGDSHLMGIMQETLDYLKQGRYGNNLLDTQTAAQGLQFSSANQVRPKTIAFNPVIPEVWAMDTLECCEKLIKTGLNPLVLVMANNETPGGGVLRGTRAQEEDICRRSGLLYAVDPQYGKQQYHCYPLNRPPFFQGQTFPASGIYVPSVPIFRAGENQNFALLDKPYTAAFGLVSANKNPTCDNNNRLFGSALEETKEKIRTILSMANLNGHRSVVLSAFGCGAYHNPPQHMAELFMEIISSEYSFCFDKIVFAIIDDTNSNNNLKIFQDVVAQYQKTLSRWN